MLSGFELYPRWVPLTFYQSEIPLLLLPKFPGFFLNGKRPLFFAASPLVSLALETKLPVVRKTSGSQGIDLRDQRKMSAIEVCLKKVWVVWDKTDLSFSQLDFPAFKMVSYSKFKECHLALSSSKKRSRAAFLAKLEIDDLSRYNGLLFHHMHMKQQCCWLISKDVPTLIGHFHDDDFWLQLPEFICFCSRIQICHSRWG